MNRLLVIAASSLLVFSSLAIFSVAQAEDTLQVENEAPELQKAESSHEMIPGDAERFLILTTDGPLLIECRFSLDGQPYRSLLENLVEQVVRSSDTNHDGKSTWKELVSNPQFSLGSSFAYLKGERLIKAIKRYDTNENDELDRPEILAFLSRQTGGDIFRLSQVASQSNESGLLFRLDKNKDHAISLDELRIIEEVLKLIDINSNDLIERSELTSRSSSATMQQGRQTIPNRNTSLVDQTGPVIHLFENHNPVSIYKRLVKQYSDPEKQLFVKDLSYFSSFYQQLDLNKDGIIELIEAVKLRSLEPVFVLDIRIGKDDRAGATVVAVHQWAEAKGLAPLQNNDLLSLKLPSLEIQFDAVLPLPNQSITKYIERTFQQYDKDKNGYLEAKEVSTNTITFKRWDLNQDEKVYPDEMKKYYHNQQTPRKCSLCMNYSVQSYSLFDALDETGDARISLRELKTGEERLALLDSNKNGKVDPSEMPAKMKINFSQGVASSRGLQPSRTNSRAIAAMTNPAGPKWFIHMDKNRDGDLTPREFLGNAETFKKIDKNNDGFIERAEAEVVQ